MEATYRNEANTQSCKVWTNNTMYSFWYECQLDHSDIMTAYAMLFCL